MRRSAWSILRNNRGAVAPVVALSLVGLIAAGGVAFDYARLASMDTELQDAADQAALAAVTQLDGQTGATNRAIAVAQSLLSNDSRFANDGNGPAVQTGQSVTDTNGNVTGARVHFYASKSDAESDTNELPMASAANITAADKAAKFVKVEVTARKAVYALTPIARVFSSGDIDAAATAGMGSAICKVPPVMICNPDEPSNNVNELLEFNPARGTGLRLVTGSATVPGNFGWLESGLGNGTPALAGELGYNVPLGPCQAATGVTTKTGMDTAVLKAFNTRFDVYENGNTTCPSQNGGTCNPAVNTRKDLTCDANGSTTQCKNNASWNPVTYDPPYVSNVPQALPTDGSLDPKIMGYPHDICHTGTQSKQTCGIKGSAIWDVNAYFRVNYGLNETSWRNQMGPPYSNVGSTQIPARYDVYTWELSHTNVGGKGISIYQPIGAPSKDAAFSFPASGNGSGIAASSTQPDRRTIDVAVLNCQALVVHGKTTNVPVANWMKVFLTEPAIKRGSGSDLYSDTKDIYVEFVEKTVASGDSFATVVRRDVPYLVK
jgi:Flp pilus assembly protein TadG